MNCAVLGATRLGAREIACSDSTVVVDDLMPFFVGIMLVLPDSRDKAAEPGDIRRDILLYANAGLPSTIAAYNEASAPGPLVGNYRRHIDAQNRRSRVDRGKRF